MCGGGKRHKKRQGKRIFLKGQQPVADPGTCSTPHAVSVLTLPGKVLAHITDEETRAQRKKKNLPEIPAKPEPNPAETGRRRGRTPRRFSAAAGSRHTCTTSSGRKRGRSQAKPAAWPGMETGRGGPSPSQEPGPQPSQSILSLSSSPLSPDPPAALTYDTATPREG